MNVQERNSVLDLDKHDVVLSPGLYARQTQFRSLSSHEKFIMNKFVKYGLRRQKVPPSNECWLGKNTVFYIVFVIYGDDAAPRHVLLGKQPRILPVVPDAPI